MMKPALQGVCTHVFLCIAACMYSFSLPTFKYSNSFPSFLLLIRVRKPYCYSLKEQERAPTIAILIVGIVKTIEREIRKKQSRLGVKLYKKQ